MRKSITTILAAAVFALTGCVANGSDTPTKALPTSTVTTTVATPGPTVTVTPKPVVKTKTVKVRVPGPTKTVYVTRSKVRVPLTQSAVKHSAPGGAAACIRKYESGGNYRAQNPSSSASGAYQFLDSTWRAVTGLSGSAKDYSPATQDSAFFKLWNGGAGAGNWTTAHLCGY